MNLGSLTTQTSRLSSDVGMTRYSGQYTDAINEAQVQFALDTRCLFKDQAYSVISGTATYSLPADFMFEKKATLATDTSPIAGLKLEPISRATLEFYVRSHDWEDDTGTPKYYIIDPESARQQLRLYPIPQGADAGTNNLILTYFPYPGVLSASTDVPLNGNALLAQFHIAIAAYAAWLLLMSEPATQEVLAQREALWKLYQLKTVECIDRFGNTISEPIRLRGGRIWR